MINPLAIVPSRRRFLKSVGVGAAALTASHFFTPGAFADELKALGAAKASVRVDSSTGADARSSARPTWRNSPPGSRLVCAALGQ